MPDDLLMAGAVLVPLAFGLIPAFLPRRVPILFRWSLWLVLLAASAAFISILSSAPPPFAVLAIAMFGLSTALSLWVLVMDTARLGRTKPDGQQA